MDDEEKGEHDWKPCSGLKDELLKCLKESACVAEVGFRLRSRLRLLLTDLRAHEHTIFATASLQEGKTPRQCLQENLAPDCNSFRYAYFECKRSLVSSLVGCGGTQGGGSCSVHLIAF